VLVTGMIIGSLFTLFVVPVFYAWIAADHAPRPARETSASRAGAQASMPTLDDVRAILPR
jgi:multidrug efflux pump